MTTAKKFTSIYVGRSSAYAFVRTFEEPEGSANEYNYEVFVHASSKEGELFSKTMLATLKKKYDLVIGPFKSQRGAEIFRDREGVNTVEQSEEIANRFVAAASRPFNPYQDR